MLTWSRSLETAGTYLRLCRKKSSRSDKGFDHYSMLNSLVDSQKYSHSIRLDETFQDLVQVAKNLIPFKSYGQNTDRPIIPALRLSRSAKSENVG